MRLDVVRQLPGRAVFVPRSIATKARLERARLQTVIETEGISHKLAASAHERYPAHGRGLLPSPRLFAPRLPIRATPSGLRNKKKMCAQIAQGMAWLTPYTVVVLWRAMARRATSDCGILPADTCNCLLCSGRWQCLSFTQLPLLCATL